MRLRLRDVMVRCVQRGYSWEEVKPCIGAPLGGDWYEVDVDHPSYPMAMRRPHQGKLAEAVANAMQAAGLPDRPQDGAGTELKALLRMVGIRPKPGCACAKRAAIMDAMGHEWCEKNIDTIVGWLKEEHARMKILLPFSEIAVKQFVRLAIRRAKRANSQ